MSSIRRGREPFTRSLKTERVAERLVQSKEILVGKMRDPLSQTILRDGMQVVGIDHAIGRHALSLRQGYFARKGSYSSGDLSDRHVGSSLQRDRLRDNNHRAEAGVARQLRPPHFAAGQEPASRLFRRPGG